MVTTSTAAVLKWRAVGAKNVWRETPMQFLENDRWRATCRFHGNGPHEFTVEAWQDTFLSWQHEFDKKFQAGITDLTTETIEGALLLERASLLAKKTPADAARLIETGRRHARRSRPPRWTVLAHDAELTVLMETYNDRAASTEMRPAIPVYVDRPGARFAAWYEFFPPLRRGQAGQPPRRSAIAWGRVDDAEAMGFDVIYFPPIHPIGFTKRKGRNNSTTSQPGEPGSPYAIGGPAGGHKTVEPTLGTLKDFDWLIKKIRAKGMEVALDFAINCSPDHPYVKDHPDWFLPTARRHDQIRRESAQTLRGHLPAQFPLRRLEGALAGDEKHHPVLVRAGGEDFPRGQSAHENPSRSGAG